MSARYTFDLEVVSSRGEAKSESVEAEGFYEKGTFTIFYFRNGEDQIPVLALPTARVHAIRKV